MKIITDDMLRGACSEQRALFRKTWPKGAAVTKANAIKAAKLGLAPAWVAERFLCKPLDDEYQAKRKPLDDEYLAKRKPLDDEYRAKRKTLYDEYQAKRQTLYDEHQAKHKTLYDEYQAKRETLDDEYLAKRKTLDAEYRAKCWQILLPILKKEAR